MGTLTPSWTNTSSPREAKGKPLPRFPHQLSGRLLKRGGRWGKTLGVGVGCHMLHGKKGTTVHSPTRTFSTYVIITARGWGGVKEVSTVLLSTLPPPWNVSSVQAVPAPPPGVPQWHIPELLHLA